MKLIAFLLFTIFSYDAFAVCKVELVKSAANYLNELEIAGLTRYQNSSVCEVLNTQYGLCSKSDKKEFKKFFKVEDVLGKICGPHLLPPKKISREDLMKGAELYSWKDSSGHKWYALLSGTNRLKNTDDLTNAAVGLNELVELLKTIPENTEINWIHSTATDTMSMDLSMPDKRSVNLIQKTAKKYHLKLSL